MMKNWKEEIWKQKPPSSTVGHSLPVVKGMTISVGGKALYLSENVFGAILTSSGFGSGLGSLPALPAGGFNPSVEGRVTDAPSCLKNDPGAANLGPPPLPIVDSQSEYEQFVDEIGGYLDVLFETGVISASSKDFIATVLLGCYLDFCLGSLTCCGIDIEQEYESQENRLTEFQVNLLNLWRIAVSIAIDLAGWYPWKLSDSKQMASLLLCPPLFYDPNALVQPLLGLLHTSPIAARWMSDGGYQVPRALLNPAIAGLAVRYEVLSDSMPADEGIAVSRLVEWFHGPTPDNAYSPFDALKLAVVTEAEWAWQLGGTFGGAPARGPNGEILDVSLDDFALSYGNQPLYVKALNYAGTQGWVHHTVTTHSFAYQNAANKYALSHWFADQIAPTIVVGDRPQLTGGSFGALLRMKRGGCYECSTFFVAAASGMNIPACFGLVVLGSGYHYTVRLPSFGEAIHHGDDLWNPGASLFSGAVLFANEAEILAPTHQYRSCLEEGEDPDSQPYKDERSALTAFSTYKVQREYFEAALKGFNRSRYQQVILDSCIFKSSSLAYPMGDAPAAFAAWHGWMKPIKNPLGVEVALSKEQKSYGEERCPIRRKDWGQGGGSVPDHLWAEPRVRGLVDEAAAYYGLKELGYAIWVQPY
jgi:hypothetical protein